MGTLLFLWIVVSIGMPKEFYTRKTDRHPHDYD